MAVNELAAQMNVSKGVVKIVNRGTGDVLAVRGVAMTDIYHVCVHWGQCM